MEESKEDEDDKSDVLQGLLYAVDIEGGLLSRLGSQAATEASELPWVSVTKRLIGAGFTFATTGAVLVVILQYWSDIESTITPLGIGTLELISRIAIAGLVVILVLLLFLRQIEEGTHPFEEASKEWVTPILSLAVGFVLLSSSGILFIQAGFDLVAITAIGMLLSGALLAGVSLITIGVHQLREFLSGGER